MNWLRTTSLALPALTLSAVAVRAEETSFNYELESTSPDGKLVYHYDEGEVAISNGVMIITDDAYLAADRVTIYQDELNKDSGRVLAEGHVRIQRGEQIWVGEKIEYNFVTGYMSAERFRTGQPPFFAAGVSLDANTETGIYTGYKVMLTADDYQHPAHRVQASSIGIDPEKTVEVYNATLFAENLPFLWLPFMKRSLNSHPSFFTLFPGYRSQYGAYALGAYHWFHEDWLETTVRADYRSERGFGTGVDFNYDLKRYGKGEFRSYYTNDRDPGVDSYGVPINNERSLIDWYHQVEIEPQFTARAMVRYQSDEYIKRDFFESQYRKNTQPSTYFELQKTWENWNLNSYVQPQLNGFQETVERLPDIKLSGYRQQVGNTPFYYESESTVGWYRRVFGDNTQPEFSAFRGDTWHQIVMPQMVGGWLSVTPRAGVRGTYYSEAQGPGATTSEELRGVFNTGVEMNFKASRVWKDVDNRFFDLKSLRHIIQPSVNYVYIPQPNVLPGELPQFDYQGLSIRPLPLTFPGYNSIDSIQFDNTVRLGLFNALQTKRKDKIANVFQWKVLGDLRINTPEDVDSWGDVYSVFDFMPRDWVTLTSEMRYNASSPDLLESNHYLTFTPQSNWSWSIGQRYMANQPSIAADYGNNLLISRLFYTLNENWGFSMYHYYSIPDSVMQEQTYSIYRDLRSWTGALSFRLRDDTDSGTDFTVAFVFSLKSMPSYKPGDDRLDSSLLFGN